MTAGQLADRLPAIEVVRRWSQSLAMLDAIMSAEWEYRYFSFDAQPSPGQAQASMRTGSGDEYSITFTKDGAFLRGFRHESPLSPLIQTPAALWAGPAIAPAGKPWASPRRRLVKNFTSRFRGNTRTCRRTIPRLVP